MTQWLTKKQQADWRAWLSASQLLNDRLDRDLQADRQLTLADYEILVRLSESPDRRQRMSELADLTLSSRSRLSHQIDRMVKAGLVERQPCDDDRRGAFAALTDFGWDSLVSAAPDHVRSVREHLVDQLTPSEFAAPDHVRSVREHLVDQLTPSEFAALGSACRKVAEHLAAVEA